MQKLGVMASLSCFCNMQATYCPLKNFMKAFTADLFTLSANIKKDQRERVPEYDTILKKVRLRKLFEYIIEIFLFI